MREGGRGKAARRGARVSWVDTEYTTAFLVLAGGVWTCLFDHSRPFPPPIDFPVFSEFRHGGHKPGHMLSDFKLRSIHAHLPSLPSPTPFPVPCPSPAPLAVQDFGLSRHILPADGINGGPAAVAAAAAAAASAKGRRASFAWESDHPLGGQMGGDDSITGGVGTYLYASPEQMSGQG